MRARNRIVRMSEIPTVPAKLQCTFSNVTQKNVAKKRKSATCVLLIARGVAPAAIALIRGSAAGRRAPRRATRARAGRATRRRAAARRGSRPASARAGRRARRGCRRRRRGRRRCRRRCRGSASPPRRPGGTTREDRALGGEVLEHLAARGRPRPRPPASGISSSSASRVALQLERAPPRHVGDQLDAVAEAEALHELAVVRDGSRRRSGRSRPRAPSRRAPAGTGAGRACRRTSPRA